MSWVLKYRLQAPESGWEVLEAVLLIIYPSEVPALNVFVSVRVAAFETGSLTLLTEKLMITRLMNKEAVSKIPSKFFLENFKKITTV